MTIQIQGGSQTANTIEQIRSSILEAIPDAEIEVRSGGPGHFELRVVSIAFREKRRVAQQQLVYAAIAHLMAGSDAPVHAVDRLECIVAD
jgi:acid stress-induced BolA-like protein IbaG/YrbA